MIYRFTFMLQELIESLNNNIDSLNSLLPDRITEFGKGELYGFEIVLKVVKDFLPAERDAIVEAHKAGDPFNNIHDAEQYYETRYGSFK